MKKILALVCAVLMVLALTACGQTAAPAESAAPAENMLTLFAKERSVHIIME